MEGTGRPPLDINGKDTILQVEVDPERQAVAEGDDVALRCQATSRTPVRIEWEKVDGTLPSRHRVQDGWLRLSTVQTSAAGFYRCIVSSQEGSGQATAEIIVNGEYSHLWPLQRGYLGQTQK